MPRSPASPDTRVERGIQIEITDPAMQAYLQRYPYAGPDAAKDREGRRALAAGIRYRPAGERKEPVIVSGAQTTLPEAEQARVREILGSLGINEELQRAYMDDFAWEVNFAPRGSRNVLVVGCGDGVELVFLRAVLPEARITALDYSKKLLPGLEEAVGVEFHAGDLQALLPSLRPEYDLLYSNHTLEHMYAPDTMLATLSGLLVKGATFLSALPAVATAGTPHLDKVQTFLERKSVDASAQIHPLDVIFFDAGHPWKTTPSDLASSLERAGLADVTVYQREGHWSRVVAMDREGYVAKRAGLQRRNGVLLQPLRAAMKALLPLPAAEKFARYLFALERRFSFGSNIVLNSFSEEVLCVGRKPI